MEKYALIKQKRDAAIEKRTERKNRRTFSISNSILAPIEITEPDIMEPEYIILEPIMAPDLLIEKQSDTENVVNEVYPEEIIIEGIPDIINPVLIAQADELRKLILRQETIKRFSKKNLMSYIYNKNAC